MSRFQQDLPVYLEIRRDWSRKPPCRHAEADSDQPAKYAATSPMMERWQQETMREQPYNAIAAVKVTQRGYTDGGTTNDHHEASKAQQLNAIGGKSGNKSV